jgi:hypothetical protein
MRYELDINRFRELKAQASEVLGLRAQAQAILARRSLRSFDGFGHFLDAVLGDDQERLDALAQTVKLPSSTIDQLRASELDPFVTSLENIAYLGFLLGIEEAEFARLANIDHGRFARHSESVLTRSQQETMTDTAEQIKLLWARFEEDQATAL